MALHRSLTALNVTPVFSVNDAGIHTLAFEFLTSSTALATGDIIELGPLMAGLAPLDVTLISDDIDSNGTPTASMSVGILNAGKTDLDNTFLASSTVGQAGGIARATTTGALLAGSSADVRHVGIKMVAGAATIAASKKIVVLLTVKA